MATVGQQLLAPETGWRRYDNTDKKITVDDSGTVQVGSYYYGGSNVNVARQFTEPNYKFNFYGTKLRIIATKHWLQSDNVEVNIDGIPFFYSAYSATAADILLLFEKTGLEYKNHFVSIYNRSSDQGNKYGVTLDAIDIDDTGYLVLFAPTNLIATLDDSQATLSWSAVEGAASYNVKCSIIAGGSYTTIATNVSDTSYIDTTVTNGTTYYYVVTAVDSSGNESANSNEASATPQAPSGHGLLRITMNDSSEREYQLSTIEIDGFINWVKGHVSTDPNCYMLNKIEVLQNSKEYLMFEKIISFEVIELIK